MKICALIPCLMVDNNRQANYAAMELVKSYGMDEIVVYDQEFQGTDYRPGFTYIGHAPKRQGFVVPRNRLLEWFYHSDYDYAFWIDANEKVSPGCMNELETIVAALKNGEVSLNVMLSTMGIQISQERMIAKQRKDYFTSVYLLRSKKGYEWMHGMIIRNFKKYYDHEIYIDERCDPWKGTSEDIYFVRLCRRLFECYLCPTLIVSKPSNKTSTWMNDQKGYSYPPYDAPAIDEMIKGHIAEYQNVKGISVPDYICLHRLQTPSLAEIKPYKPRKKGKK